MNVEMVSPLIPPVDGERDANFFFADDHVIFSVSLLILTPCSPLTLRNTRCKAFCTAFMAICSRASRRRRVVSYIIKSTPSWFWTMSRRWTSADSSKFFTAGQSGQPSCAFDCSDWYCVSLTDSPPLAAQDEWASVLALAHAWDFPAIRALAIQKLTPITSAIDKIVLAREHAVDEWLGDSYLAVCEAPTLPPPEDCRRLGMDDLIRVIGAWEAMHTLPNALESRELRLAAFRAVFGPGLKCSASFEKSPDVRLPVSAPELPTTGASPVPPPIEESENGLIDVVPTPHEAFESLVCANEVDSVNAQATVAPEPAAVVKEKKPGDDWAALIKGKNGQKNAREGDPISFEDHAPAVESTPSTPIAPPPPPALELMKQICAGKKGHKSTNALGWGGQFEEPADVTSTWGELVTVRQAASPNSPASNVGRNDDRFFAAQASKGKDGKKNHGFSFTFSFRPKPDLEPEHVITAPELVVVRQTASLDPPASDVGRSDDWFSAAQLSKGKDGKNKHYFSLDLEPEPAAKSMPSHVAKPSAAESGFLAPGGFGAQAPGCFGMPPLGGVATSPSDNTKAEAARAGGLFGMSNLSKKTGLFGGLGDGWEHPEEPALGAAPVSPSAQEARPVTSPAADDPAAGDHWCTSGASAKGKKAKAPEVDSSAKVTQVKAVPAPAKVKKAKASSTPKPAQVKKATVSAAAEATQVKQVKVSPAPKPGKVKKAKVSAAAEPTKVKKVKASPTPKPAKLKEAKASDVAPKPAKVKKANTKTKKKATR
jgi:hypothetical protein